MSFRDIVPDSSEIPRPKLRSAIGMSLREFADSIPDTATLAAHEKLKEQEREKLCGDFVDFVISGALDVAEILREKKARPEYFAFLRFGEPVRDSLGGFVLKGQPMYGGRLKNPKYDIMPMYHRKSETRPSTHKLIIMARSGELAIAGYSGQNVLLDTSLASSQWFNREAISDNASYERLKLAAQSDMEHTLQTYLSRR